MTDAPPIRLLLVDDHKIVRDGVTAMLDSEPGITVVAEAANGDDAIRLYREHRPDVVIMDLRLPGMSGAQCIGKLREEFPAAAFVVLTTFDSDEDIFQAVEAGAQAYLLKDSFQPELVSAIRTVHEGRRLIPDAIAKRLQERSMSVQLSRREIEVLEHVARGDGNKVIGAALGISAGTIKSHLLRIYGKLGVDDRTSAVTTAITRGILKL